MFGSLVLISFLAVAGMRRLKRHSIGLILSFGCLLFLLPGVTQAQTAITLSAARLPSTGSSGGNVSITGSGFPSGAVTPGNVSITVFLDLRWRRNLGYSVLYAPYTWFGLQGRIHYPWTQRWNLLRVYQWHNA